MTYTYIKLKGGKEGKIWCTRNYSFSYNMDCIWCSKEIKPQKAVFHADGYPGDSCCSMAHAKALLNAKI